MKKFGVMLGLAALFVLLTVVLAEAARLGGGRSFGSRSTYSRSYSRPVAPSSGYATQKPQQTQPQQNVQPGPAATPPLGAQPGLFSRMGWGLGGLFAGGLIGSMLFGHGYGGMGGGIGFFDLLLLGLIIYLAVKLLRRRTPPPDSGPGNGPGNGPDIGPGAGQGGWQSPPSQPQSPQDDAHARAAQSWDSLRSKPAAGNVGGFGAPEAKPEPEAQPVAEPVVPQGFSIPDFLEGAKTVYARLQHSWDRRDLDDIALFTTPEVLDEIRRQAAADPAPSKTELLLINARLLEFREDPRDTVASVYFDVLMREDAAEERSKQIREVWHFSRPTGDLEANWRLEGIQQLEA